MLILNYSHPLTEGQLQQIEQLLGQKISEVRHIPAQLDQDGDFSAQITALVDMAGLSAKEWQNTPLLIVPPALNFIAVALLAQLHGLMGYFPDCIRLRPIANSRPPQFEVADILNLQDYRQTGRAKRYNI